MPKPSQENYVPSHKEFIVEFVPGEYRSSLRTRQAFKKGEVMAPLRGLTRGPKRYTSVQCGKGPDDHIELNSDLVYINHSCDPNVAFDLSSRDPSQWHLRALKDIKAGETLGFFYPSTEWDMDQPFKCECNARSCLGTVAGAKYLSKTELLAHGFVNKYILELAAERDGEAKLQSRL
ncbi:hypothetical protein CC1G_05693 [Coprinopsis cinerea okayama7|uniref:SET domain-containing protein n=1 Tax=Coprinopsis cinerea (strain Okayama-7 / 130 / ATCC MYA-4618 / FGSC 9003) TaxID=240176 RepID=A8N9W6_COPC7|nr:hypothetical protein CC1G_05693 [Coprinopsis cinerea okayama7\|eukprot:XP_001831622.1 hypothetical protein CC1G_05693 [Coprinopsis cinerea okayama7\